MTPHSMAQIVCIACPTLRVIPEDPPSNPEAPAAVYAIANDGEYCFMQVDPTWGETAMTEAIIGLCEFINQHGGFKKEEVA